MEELPMQSGEVDTGQQEEKAGHAPRRLECLEMHDEKRPKVEKAESGCGASAMQERSPDSRDRGAALLRLHLPRQERVRDTR